MIHGWIMHALYNCFTFESRNLNYTIIHTSIKGALYNWHKVMAYHSVDGHLVCDFLCILAPVIHGNKHLLYTLSLTSLSSCRTTLVIYY